MLAGHDIGHFVRSWSGQPHSRACVTASLPGIWWLHRRQTQPGVGFWARLGACLTPVAPMKTCAPRAPPVRLHPAVSHLGQQRHTLGAHDDRQNPRSCPAPVRDS
jgi:hypothetical protein